MILSGRRPGGGASSTICLVKAPQCHTYVGSLIVGPSRLSSCLSSVLAINVHTHRHPPSALDTRPPVQTKAAARTYIACCPNGKKQIDGGYHRAKARRGLLSSPSRPRPPSPLPSDEARLLIPFYTDLPGAIGLVHVLKARLLVMAAPSRSPSIGSSQGSTVRPQADPLPTKRGEIGYRESLNPPASPTAVPESDVTARQTSLPARHPADRDPRPASPEPEPVSITDGNGNQSAAESPSSSAPLFSFLKPKVTKFGVRVSTILLLVTQGSLLLATICLWVILAKLVLPSSNVGRQLGLSALVHIMFTICTIVQVVLLERLFFRYRAERYAMLHPGEPLPDLFDRGEQISTRLALAPWNRPPLPTVNPVLRLSVILTSEALTRSSILVFSTRPS